jgi:dynein heavy chain
MIYMEPTNIGWKPLVQSWSEKLPAWLDAPAREHLDRLFQWATQPILDFVKWECKEFMPTSPMDLVNGLMTLISCQLPDILKLTENDANAKPLLNGWLTTAFIFSAVWSLGAVVNFDGRTKFDGFLRKLLSGAIGSAPVPKDSEVEKSAFPAEGLVYDYVFEREVIFIMLN